MLGTDPRDLRATFEIAPSSGFDIILADTTPGGAGYARKLVEESRFSTRKLLLEALDKLDCEMKCQSTCVHCLNDYSNQIWWDRMDRHISREWLERIVARSIMRPAHVPDDAVPCLPPVGFALGTSLKGYEQVIAVGSGTWGAEEPEGSLGSARALRDWLEDDSERRIWMVVPLGEENEPTAIDRRIAELLRAVEDDGRLKFVKLPVEKLVPAPRLTLFTLFEGIPNEEQLYEELYEDMPRGSLLSGLGAGVCFRRHGMEDSSALWIAKHVQDVLKAPQSDVFGKLLDRMVVHRFKAGTPRDIQAVFSDLRGRNLRLEIQDPWMAAQSRNRAKLAEYLRALQQARATIEKLTLVWNPKNGNDASSDQTEGLRSSSAPYVSGEIELKPWVPSQGQHFHDRVVHISIVESGEKWRVDVTSGIDNLMSYQKECNLFIEKR